MPRAAYPRRAMRVDRVRSTTEARVLREKCCSQQNTPPPNRVPGCSAAQSVASWTGPGQTLLVALLTSKGASGISGAGFITLAATLATVNPALVPGMAILLGIDKFMSECRALVNFTGNGVATVVVAWWEGELDRDKLNAGLNRDVDPSDVE